MPDYSVGELRLRANVYDDHILSLELIRKATESIWNNAAIRIIHNFTAHDLEHSKRVANWADTITKAYTGRGKLLSELETYLLLAGIYLHDIGMQCDLNKWPDIKKIAEGLGARFTCEFNTTNSSDFTPEQQQETRSNHQYLAAAWIEYAREHDKGTLGNAVRSVPNDNVGDLMDICQYHAKLDIKLCPAKCDHSENRKRLTAAILRYADELDIDANRVVIDTVKYFNLPPKSTFIWWLHNYTSITNITPHCLLIRIVMHTEDVQNYGSLVYDHFIAGFQVKNQPIRNVLIEYGISLETHGESNVESNNHKERFPAEIIKVIQEMQREDVAGGIRKQASSLKYLFHSSSKLNPNSMDEQIINPMRHALAETYLARGSLSVWQADPQQVIRDCDEALHLEPDLTVAYYTRGLANLQQGDNKRAIEDLGKLLASNPQHLGALLHRGDAYCDIGEYDLAVADYTEALCLRPGMAEVYNNRGATYRKKGAYDEAIADYTEALHLRPRDAVAYNNRSIAYRKKGAFVEAIADCDEALRQQPDLAEAYHNRGDAYSGQGAYDLAITDFTKALRLRPGYAEAYNNRGDAYGDKGDLDQAIADYTQALALWPEYAVAHYNRGTTYSEKGEYDQAIADYTEALRLRPDMAEACYNRGTAYGEKGEYDQAIADYTQALRLRPGYAKAYNNRGAVYSNKGDHDQAIADFTEALRLRPEDADAYYNRGIAYVNKGEYDQAIADYTHALHLRPEYAEAYNNLAYAYLSKHAFDKALASINHAIKLQPDDDDYYDSRADVYLAMGDIEPAIADSRWVLEHSQDANLRRQSEERLRKLGVEPDSASSP